jgi:hypothetical protein
MPDRSLSLSEELIALDRATAAATGHLAAQEVFERRLSGRGWIAPLAMGGGGMVGALLCGTLVITEPFTMPPLTRVSLAVLMLVCATWAALGAWILRRGAVDSRVQGALAVRMGFGFSLLTSAGLGALFLARPESRVGPGGVLLLLVPLFLSATILIVFEVRQAELRTRLKLLDLEYRLTRPPESPRP